MNTILKQFEPAFDFSGSISSVLLHKGIAEIQINGGSYTGDCEVRLDLLPRPRVRFYGKFLGVSPIDSMMVFTEGKKILSFSINGHTVEGFLTSIGGDVRINEIAVTWVPNFTPFIGIGDESTQISYVIFHIFNFNDFHGMRRSEGQNETKRCAIEHTDLTSDDWKVELKSLLETENNINKLKAEGGYQLTHIGYFERLDGGPFSGNDANDYLNALRFFLSFAKGAWCEPVCAVGFDTINNRVWESWSSPRESWHISQSWFDPFNSSQLANLFPAFMKKWSNDDWREALHEVIYWYLNSNHSARGIDAGIILSQAAIERLSYEFSVKEKRLLKVKGFKDLWASDKFRILFSSLGIPIDIPPETSEIQQMAASSQIDWQDAPHALTEIRNSLVHPEHKRRGQFQELYYEAWNLSLWYLEMGILAICGYSGTYSNRLRNRWAGQVEAVPWLSPH